MAETLARLRADVDELDERLAMLLAERFELTKRESKLRLKGGIDYVSPDREKYQLEHITRFAKKVGAPGDVSRAILRIVIDKVAELHEARKARFENEDEDEGE